MSRPGGDDSAAVYIRNAGEVTRMTIELAEGPVLPGSAVWKGN
jgi:hypothetical protein